MHYHSSAASGFRWFLGLCFSLAFSLQSVRAIPFSVNLLGEYKGTVKDGEKLPSTYAGTSLLYGIESSGLLDDAKDGVLWQQTGDTGLFKTTFSVDNLIASLQLTSSQRPEVTYLALQAGDEYAVWDIRSWNSWRSDSLLVINDRITTVQTIRMPFLGALKISVPDDITGIALYGPLVVESPGSDADDRSGGFGIVLGGDIGSQPTRVPDGGSVFALLAIGIAAAAFMTRRAS
jgi:hypothetical protein